MWSKIKVVYCPSFQSKGMYIISQGAVIVSLLFMSNYFSYIFKACLFFRGKLFISFPLFPHPQLLSDWLASIMVRHAKPSFSLQKNTEQGTNLPICLQQLKNVLRNKPCLASCLLPCLYFKLRGEFGKVLKIKERLKYPARFYRSKSWIKIV